MPTKYRIVPERVGRHRDITPFIVVIEDDVPDHAQQLAEGLHNWVRDYLMSDEYNTAVDLNRGKFTIEGGRFGEGRVEIKEEVRSDVTAGA